MKRLRLVVCAMAKCVCLAAAWWHFGSCRLDVTGVASSLSGASPAGPRFSQDSRAEVAPGESRPVRRSEADRRVTALAPATLNTARSARRGTPILFPGENGIPSLLDYPSTERFSRSVLQVIGLGGDGEGFGARLAALASLSRSIGAIDRYALYVFLLDSARTGSLTEVQEHVLVNDVMEKLRQQADGAPELAPVLAAVYRNKTDDPVVRAYAIQHLGNWFQHNASDGRMQDALWEAARDTESGIAGTALLSLNRASRSHPNVDTDRLGREAAKVAVDTRASPAARVTALGIAAAHGAALAVETARQLAADSRCVAVQAAAIAVLGEYGSVQDRDLLERLATDESVRCSSAVAEALRRWNAG